MWANGHLIDTAFKKNQKRRKIRRRSFKSSIKREVRPFYVVVMQRRQRNVPKSVMHVQRCCFSQKILFLRWPPVVAVFVVALTLLCQVLIIYPSLPGLSVKKIYQTWSAAIVFYYTGTYLCWLLSLFSRTTLPTFYINFALMMGVVRATWYLQIFFYQPLY